MSDERKQQVIALGRLGWPLIKRVCFALRLRISRVHPAESVKATLQEAIDKLRSVAVDGEIDRIPAAIAELNHLSISLLGVENES